MAQKEQLKNETQINYLQAQEENKTREFLLEYQRLCEKYNRALTPAIKMDVVYVNPPDNLVGAISGANPSRK